MIAKIGIAMGIRDAAIGIENKERTISIGIPIALATGGAFYMTQAMETLATLA